jgi:O-antigen ligase
MPPQAAALTCALFIAYLLWFDRRRRDEVSAAVWIPILWMLFAGSRYLSQWLDIGHAVTMTAEDYSEGSPLDRVVFLALTLAACWVLVWRRLDWLRLIGRNKWILLFFMFGVISLLWADDPLVAFKRWVKGFGNLAMALVLLSERRPYEALGFALRRLAFVLIPLSVLFIRFYPELGRTYHHGTPMFTGVAFSKNSLGQLCLLLGTYFCWEIVFRRLKLTTQITWVRLLIYLVILGMIAWILLIADSATSLALMLAAACIMALARLPAMVRQPPLFIGMVIVGALVLGLLEWLFGIKAQVIQLLGRDPDLTSRTPVWRMLIDMVENPWIGAGYEMFWSGERLTAIWARMGFEAGGIIQAHNGYIETYLNLGIIGVLLLVFGILAGLLDAASQLRHRSEYAHAMLRISFILLALVYNYTEAAYKPLNNVFVLLLFSIIHVTILPPLTKPVSINRRKASPVDRGTMPAARMR